MLRLNSAFDRDMGDEYLVAGGDYLVKVQPQCTAGPVQDVATHYIPML